MTGHTMGETLTLVTYSPVIMRYYLTFCQHVKRRSLLAPHQLICLEKIGLIREADVRSHFPDNDHGEFLPRIIYKLTKYCRQESRIKSIYSCTLRESINQSARRVEIVN